MSRQTNNQHLLNILQELIKENPTQRFSQILQNYGFIDTTTISSTLEPQWVNEFYKEPEVILDRVKRKVTGYDSV